MQYFRFQFFHPDFQNPKELWFEIGASCSVKRTLQIDYGGEAVCNSVAILSHRSSAFNDFALSGSNEPCLRGNRLSSPQQLIEECIQDGYVQKPASAVEFNKLFMSARPAL